LNLVPENKIGLQARVMWNDGTAFDAIINIGATITAYIFILLELDIDY